MQKRRFLLVPILFGLCLFLLMTPPQIGNYRIQPGDTLYRIASHHPIWGGWRRLATLNHLEHPDHIRTGNLLLVPLGANVEAAKPEPPPKEGDRPPLREMDTSPTVYLDKAMLPCPIHVWPKLKKTPALPKGVQFCRDGGHGRRLCQQLLEEEGREAYRTEWVDVVKGKTKIMFRSPYWERQDDFQVWDVDLDADGQKEVIIAARDGISDGMAVSYWYFYLLRPEGPLQWRAEDIGESSLTAKEGGGCQILATYWEWAGEHNYYTGRIWDYRDGQLIPTDGPILARPYLYSFEAERWETIEGKWDLDHFGIADPASWLAPGRTGLYPKERYTAGTYRSGTILTAVASPDAYSFDRLIVRLLMDDGEMKILLVDGAYGERSAQLGDLASRRFYPPAYRPADVQGWLEDRAVVLEEGAPDEPLKLWLRQKP